MQNLTKFIHDSCWSTKRDATRNKPTESQNWTFGAQERSSRWGAPIFENHSYQHPQRQRFGYAKESC